MLVRLVGRVQRFRVGCLLIGLAYCALPFVLNGCIALVAGNSNNPSVLKITTTSLAAGTVGSAYSANPQAGGGRPPYVWSLTAGVLPTGLSLAAATGAITGMPAVSGSTSLTLHVKDSGFPTQTASQSLSIVVATSSSSSSGPPSSGPLQITTTALPGGNVDANYSATLAASGGTPPYLWSITSGALPAGLSLAGPIGEVGGTPTQTGTSSITAVVQDSSSPPQSGSHVYSIAIGVAGIGVPITACQTLANAGTIYALQNDVSSATSCFNVQADNITINLNGHTITYSSSPTPPTYAVFGIYGAAVWDPNFKSGGIAFGNTTGGSWNNLTVAGRGTITQGNCLDVSNNLTGSNAIHMGQGAGDGLSVFNVTFNICGDSTQAINSDANGAGVSVHDNIVNDKVVSAQRRSSFQGVAFLCEGCGHDNGAPSNFFNNTITGGPQGCIMWSNPNTNLYNNSCAQGNSSAIFTTPTSTLVCESNPYTNAAGTLPLNAGTQCTNDFGLYTQGAGASIFGNTVTPREGRGILVGGGCYSLPCSGASPYVHDNTAIAQEFPNNSEYSGCEIGGAWGLEWREGPLNSRISHNNITAITNTCAASAFRVQAVFNYNNVSQGNTYTASRASGASSNCASVNGVLGAHLQNGQQAACAYAAAILGASNASYPVQFISQNDTFVGDSGCFYFDWDSSPQQPVFISPTCNKGSNADSSWWHTFVVRNGASAGSVAPHFRDMNLGSGVSLTDASIPAVSAGSEIAASIYVDWTLTLTVQNQAGSPVSGATVTYTDSLSHSQCSATTNSSGVAVCVLTEYRLNNDTGANQIENRNPFSFRISAPACTTLTGSESITTTATETKQLAGC